MNFVRALTFAISLTLGLISSGRAAPPDEVTFAELSELLENPQDSSAPNYCAGTRQYLEKNIQATLKDQITGSSVPQQEKIFVGPATCTTAFTGTFNDPYQPGPVPFALAQQLNKALSVSTTDLACVAAAQKIFGPSGYGFADCTGKTEKKYRNAGSKGTRVPCRSISHVMTVARSIDTVAACTGADARDLFRLFAKESGVMLNSLSWSGVAGIGQTSGIAIRQVQEVDQGISMFKNAKRVSAEIKENIYGGGGTPAKPYCRNLQGLETNFDISQSNNDCSILGFPQVALLPTLLGAKTYLYIRAEIEAFASEHGMKKTFGADYSDIIRAATYYSYSAAGPTVGRAAFQAVALAAKGKNWSREKVLAVLRERVLARTPGRVRGEVEDYFQSNVTAKNKVGTEDFYKKVKEKVGGRECF